MENKCLFRVGLEVWSIVYGWGKVVTLNKSVLFSVEVVFSNGLRIYFTIDGKEFENVNRTLFFEEIVIPASALERPIRPAKELLNECKEEEFKFGKKNYYIISELYSNNEVGFSAVHDSRANIFGVKYISEEDADYIVANCKENQRGDLIDELEKF